MKRNEFVESYLDQTRLIDIFEELGPDADVIEYDEMVSLIKESTLEALKYYTNENDDVEDINYRHFNGDIINRINRKIDKYL